MATEKRKRLSKALQDYKMEIKSMTFQEKVKEYFNCSPYLRDIDNQKKDIIFHAFTKDERQEYLERYSPILSSINRYGDRVRAINSNRLMYTIYIENALRRRDYINYTADLLNLALPKIKEALESIEKEETKKTLQNALEWLQTYKEVAPDTMTRTIKLNERGDTFTVDNKENDIYLLEVIQTLKGILSLLKCYLESLREFLAWVGKPELLPQEFKDMEDELRGKYRGIEIPLQVESEEAQRFPQWSHKAEAAREFVGIDYDTLPRSVDIFGEKNLWAETYRRFFI